MLLRLDGVGTLLVVAASLVLPSPLAHCEQVDARAEVAAALYAASATQAAAERVADSKLRAQRKEIEQLRLKVGTSAAETANLRSELASKEEQYVAELAAKDRAYDTEISVFRAAVQDIAATPEGAAALARFNAGDEVGALKILDDLTKARDAARQKREQIESAADRRRTAMLALDARAKGKVTTEQAIARFEEVTRLDPGVQWDWVELVRLYQSAGRLTDARIAAEHAADTAKSERDQEVAMNELGDVQAQQGDVDGALASYRKEQGIVETLAGRDPDNMEWQRDLSVSYQKVGDVQAQQGDVDGALVSYRKALTIRETLTGRDPGNAEWQRDLILSLAKVGTTSGEKSYLKRALDLAVALKNSGKLAPADDSLVEELRRVLSQ